MRSSEANGTGPNPMNLSGMSLFHKGLGSRKGVGSDCHELEP